MRVEITGQYAVLSRGRICAKHMATKEWAEKGNGTVIIAEPRKWMLSQNDGFARKDTTYVEVDDEGNVTGNMSRFRVIS